MPSGVSPVLSPKDLARDPLGNVERPLEELEGVFPGHRDEVQVLSFGLVIDIRADVRFDERGFRLKNVLWSYGTGAFELANVGIARVLLKIWVE